ncbi:MAG: sigma-54-dependent Fis family transcriptional regulator [Acidobacteria bacterium]|nr:sigma-54-dependent Fis family transcriptional regulator [Acidobacteriota bacterium]
MKTESSEQSRVLIADSDFNFAMSFQKALIAACVPAVIARTSEEATGLARSSPNLCLAFVDAQLASQGGLALMQRLHHVAPGLSVILVSASGDLTAAVEATKQGAEDYILKPFEFAPLVKKVGHFLELFQQGSKDGVPAFPPGSLRGLDDFIYRSQAMQAVLDEARAAAPMEVSVLLVGECGVGKDMLARAIHMASPRTNRTFMKIDCPSFAHDNPSADSNVSAAAEAALQRIFEATAGGTLFLSEVGGLPESIQDMLVEILDQTSGRREENDIRARSSPRVLASTTCSAAELPQKYPRNMFFSRLAEVILEIPPLRSRPEDISPLVRYFLSRLGQRYNHQFVMRWSGLDLLLRYSLPGNVRELECILERAAANQLQAPRSLADGDLRLFLDQSGIPQEKVMPDELTMDLSHVEQLAIQRALWFAKGNRTKAAALLRIDRTTLYSKMRRSSKAILAD